MKQLELLENVCTLPNGQEVKDGDVIMCEYGPYYSIVKLKNIDGYLCFDHFMHGENTKLMSMAKATYCKMYKLSPKQVYLFCKENKWPTSEYLGMFNTTTNTQTK